MLHQPYRNLNLMIAHEIEELNGKIKFNATWITGLIFFLGVTFWTGYNYEKISDAQTRILLIEERQRDVRERLAKMEAWDEIETRVINDLREHIQYTDKSDEKFVAPSRITGH
jgi:hypothetical protein